MKNKKGPGKDVLEQTLLIGIHGVPELKREERQRLLGQFRERVIKVLTFKQIAEPGIYAEIKDAVAHPQARRLIISRKADLSGAAKYIRLARRQNMAFTTVDLPEFKGPVGLVVAADEAVDAANIEVADRTERLLAAGVPREVIEARGQTLCKACLDLLQRVAPEEVVNYRKEGVLSRLLGKKCPCKLH